MRSFPVYLKYEKMTALGLLLLIFCRLSKKLDLSSGALLFQHFQ